MFDLLRFTERKAKRVHVLLLLVAGNAALWGVQFLPGDLQAVASLSLMQTCALAAAAVWALREQSEDDLATPEENADAFERAADVVRNVLNPKFERRAAYAALLSGMVGVPAFMSFLTKDVPEWSVYLACFGVAECAYSYLLAALWRRQIRDHKNQRAAADRRRRERVETMRAMAEVEQCRVSREETSSPPIMAVFK